MKQIICYFCMMMLVPLTNAATTWYVTKNGKDTNTGKSESAAFLTIQKAIDKSSAGDTIIVGDGSYAPINVAASKEPLVIRSTGGASKCTINGGGARCVTIGTGVTTNVYIIGFTLTGGFVSGNAGSGYHGPQYGVGAGIYGGSCSNCVITGNSSNYDSASACKSVLYDCQISNNTCGDWSGGVSDCVLYRCKISSCKGRNGVGGAGSSTLMDCVIENCSSTYGPAGATDSILYRCVVKNNSTGGDRGGGVNNCTCYDCVIFGNKSVCGSGAFGGTTYNCTIVNNVNGSYESIAGGKHYNSILGGSGAASGNVLSSSATCVSCLLWNISDRGAVLKNCMTGVPKFVGDSDYHLQTSSPCVDKGDNSYVITELDCDGKPRIRNGRVDVGAYERQPSEAIVRSVVASGRYPWNGKVDLEFTIEGDAGTKYDTSFTAMDVAGGTNLTMKTLYKSDGSAANVAKEQLLPGTYNWVWNATADLCEGVVLDCVTIFVNVQ